MTQHKSVNQAESQKPQRAIQETLMRGDVQREKWGGIEKMKIKKIYN